MMVIRILKFNFRYLRSQYSKTAILAIKLRIDFAGTNIVDKSSLH
jgi:hypothetical protein